jgi:hypothetical protein
LLQVALGRPFNGVVRRSSLFHGTEARPLRANTSLSALVSSERPGQTSRPRGSKPPEPRKRPPSLLKLLALGASVAGCVVFGLGLRSRGSSSLTQSVLHGSAGIKHTKGGAEVRWRSRASKVVIDASVEKLGAHAVSAVQDAFGTWLGSDQKLPGLTFDTTRGARVVLEPDGKNTILVAPITVRGHEHDLAITLTYSDENTGAIVEADIVINAEYAFRVLNEDEGDGDAADAKGEHQRQSSCAAGGSNAKRCSDGAYDLQNVLTHEVGHFFGLGEEMSDGGATMYYCTSRCETHKRALTHVDTDSISGLYLAAAGESPEAETEPQGGCAGARIGTRGSLSEAGIALGAALFLVGRRRRAR